MRNNYKMPKAYEMIKDIYKHPETNLSDICRRINITYSHVSKLSQEMQEDQIIFKQKTGRKNMLSLTNKGKKIYEGLIKIDGALKNE